MLKLFWAISIQLTFDDDCVPFLIARNRIIQTQRLRAFLFFVFLFIAILAHTNQVKSMQILCFLNISGVYGPSGKSLFLGRKCYLFMRLLQRNSERSLFYSDADIKISFELFLLYDTTTTNVNVNLLVKVQIFTGRWHF